MACLIGLKYNLIGLLPLVLLLVPGSGWGGGLTVEPGGLLIQKVPLGEAYDLSKESGITLKIYNKLDTPITYKISAKRPSETGSGRWMAGYQEIPDPAWFRFEEEEITVAGGKTGSVNMFIEIPGADAYYNQKWVIALGVTTQVKSGESIALAVYPRFLIETESREEITGRPAGKTGIRPGVLYLSPPFHEKKGSIEIYNNDNIPHTYTIRPEIPPSGIQGQVLPTPSYDWLPNPVWIVPDQDAVEVGPGGKRSVGLHLETPQSESLPLQKWEALLFIRPDKGPSTFGRILILP